MVLFPFISFVISAFFTASLIRRYVQKHRLHELIWIFSFSCFAIASISEVIGDVWGWNEFLARLYYLTGAMLVVGFLGLGNIILIGSGRTVTVAGIIMSSLTCVSIFAVSTATLQTDKLLDTGWQAIHTNPLLLTLTITINSIGTLVVLFCALYSAWKMWRSNSSKQKMWGLIWIAVGTMVVASGGTLTRLGHHEYLYLAMAPGVLLIFYGYLLTIRVINQTEIIPAAYKRDTQPLYK
jgi:uncharacterized membrane protein